MKIKYILYLLLGIFFLSSCENEVIKPDPNHQTRTILVYMIASNLGLHLNNNIEDMLAVANNQNLNGGNLIVFYSESKNNAELFQIKEGKNGVVTKHHIADYTNQSAISPKVMKSVIERVVSEYPADSYGMILSSHGTSWLPADYNTMLRSFGEENGKKMEIYEMAEAIPDHLFDFLLFDACSMGGVECVYELKDKADYIVASPSETMVAGFPYQTVLPFLFENTANLEKAVEAFYNFYKVYRDPYGNIAITKTSELNKLATLTKEIISASGGEKAFYSLPYSDLQTLSYLSYCPTRLYDFEDVMKKLATPDQSARFTACMKGLIVSKYHTDKLYCSKDKEKYTVNTFSGLSVYPPQEKLTQLNEWYKQLEWYKAVYQ